MSVTRLAQIAVSTEAVNDPAVERVPAARPTYGGDSALNRIAEFIPAEVIGVYTALWGLTDPGSAAAKWAVFGVGLALVPVVFVLTYMVSRRRAAAAGAGVRPARSLRVSVPLLVFALLAFVAWAAAMPGNPFTELSEHALRFGGGAVLVLGLLLPMAAEALGLAKSAPDPLESAPVESTPSGPVPSGSSPS